MWRDYFKTEYAQCNNTVIFKSVVKYHHDVIGFSFPFRADYHCCLDNVVEYCHAYNLPVIFFNVVEHDVKKLKQRFGDIKICYYEDWSDYLYTAGTMTSLAGRKLSGQRNHINFFKRTYSDYSFEEINKDNISDVVEFFRHQSSESGKSTDILTEEYVKTIEVFDNYDSYNIHGGLLRVDGSIIGFSLGEILNNVLFIHIEKADIRYRGAYQVLNNEFAKHFCSGGVKFINRAEDNGDEGLKTAKLAYHPCKMLDKYIVEVT